jgi:hypothetical protein
MAQRLASAGNAMSTFAMQFEPLYDTDPHTGASVEVFYADAVLAASFGASAGWVLVVLPPRKPAGEATGAFSYWLPRVRGRAE